MHSINGGVMDNLDLGYYEDMINSFYDREENIAENTRRIIDIKTVVHKEEPKTNNEIHELVLQKIYSTILILLSLFSIIVLQGEAAIAIILIPLALYLMFTKTYWLNL